MGLHRRNVIKRGAALVAALCLALSAPLLQAQSGKVEVLWLGQATFKITTPGGKVIVIDPFVTGNPKNTRRPQGPGQAGQGRSDPRHARPRRPRRDGRTQRRWK
jgi:hypothetical protein